MRLRRLRRFWPAIPVLLTLLIVYIAMPGRSTYTISPETTFVTGPLQAQGQIDYPTALNERLSAGVTPETNANVLIWQALGPKPEGGAMPPDFFRWLGVAAPPEQGEYFLSREKYFQAHIKDRPPGDMPDDLDLAVPWDPRQQWNDQVDRAAKWPWTAKDQPDVAAWLKQNEKPLAILVEASKRPHYYNPLVSTSTDPRGARLIGCLLPSVQKCREAGTALCCRAMSRVADGDFDGAWQDLLACQRLGRLIASRGSLIESLVGIAIENLAITAQATFLSRSRDSSKQILARLVESQSLPPLTLLADKLDSCERFLTLDTLQSIALQGGRNLNELAAMADSSAPTNNPLGGLFRRSVDFDPAFKNANRMFDRAIAASRKPDRASRKQEFASLEAEINSFKATVQGTNALDRMTMGKTERGEQIGLVLITLLFPALDKMQDAYDRAAQNQVNSHLAFALAAHRADTGRYPARLDDLVPKYLPSVPADVFSGKPMIYKPSEAAYLLYSVGVNGQDDGGRWTDDDPKGDDLRVRMPVPSPK